LENFYYKNFMLFPLLQGSEGISDPSNAFPCLAGERIPCTAYGSHKNAAYRRRTRALKFSAADKAGSGNVASPKGSKAHIFGLPW